MAWHGLPEWNTVALFCIRDSLTSISLSSIEDFPLSFLSSILKLSQLTSLIINGITVKDDTGSNKMPVTSQLDKLQTLCLTSHSVNTYDLTTLLPTILTTASQSLSQLRWYDAASYHRQLKYSKSQVQGPMSMSYLIIVGHIPIQGLTKLREFSTSVDGHRITLLSVVHQIVASRRRGIQVLELFDADVLKVEVNIKSHEQLWGEFDQLFQEEAFADLREIRFLVKKILTNKSIPIRHHPIVGRIFMTEEVVSFFASFCPRAMARGVRFTYAEEREALSIK
ncbi:hypothetical protein CPB84DRAFT_1783799 [Gymnopilus junonius]|uniref:Uncharacterized protein n=1 Tax=Gymnopilus junonius TaxID=109634 RepID=A0A9P5NL75_GYMJU|nr:hypothetical protein CPB84DRAFT_1783799 [Gymnopilus junonius]